jgi:hypothetical protein
MSALERTHTQVTLSATPAIDFGLLPSCLVARSRRNWGVGNMDRPTSKSSTAYGHACSNCVKAKCKCIPREGRGCERYISNEFQVWGLHELILNRCHRLSKSCQPATFVRKAGSQRTARKSQLEDKLDSLVTLLQVGYMINRTYIHRQGI